ncbi:MAG: DUF2752 domain-containing protein [Sphingomonadales bacterium]|nr:DUF2752 domain-containing protein [Sphingomonadales bacterium]
MKSGKRQVYVVLLLVGFAGYLWLGWSLSGTGSISEGQGVCLFKSISGYPCPACGTTRSMVHLFSGDFTGSLRINPLGIISLIMLLVVPLWALCDVLSGQRGIFCLYRSAELWIRKPGMAIPFLLILLANWIWGISKGL